MFALLAHVWSGRIAGACIGADAVISSRGIAESWASNNLVSHGITFVA